MEQPTQAQNPQMPPQTPPQMPIQQPQQNPQQPMPAQPAQKKSQAWAWVLGGCLTVVVLGMIAFLALGWWGMRKVKNEIQPNIDNIKSDIEKMNKEGEEWEKKSKEFMESIPDPEDITNDLQNSN